MTYNISRIFTAAMAVFCLASSQAFAASISYGDFDDIPPGVVKYIGVSESSDWAPVFGPPEVSVNTIDWDPGKAPANQFIASAGGGSIDSMDGQLNFVLMTMAPETGVTSLAISEDGDYDLFGTGTAATQVGAGLTALIDILEVDGKPISFYLPGTTKIEVNASNFKTFDLVADGPTIGTPWDNGLLVEFGPALINAGITSFDYGVTKAEVAINDSLIAISESATVSEIVKKDFTITPGGNLDPKVIVPEPAALAMLLCGLVGFATRR